MDTMESSNSSLPDRIAGLTGAAVERRHEALMEWAETELNLDRSYAEQVYTIAEEEQLLPVYGFLLIQSGFGVVELEPPEEDEDDDTTQQAPPGSVGTTDVRLDDIELERRLRSSFRRLRSRIEEAASPAEGARAFLDEFDVERVRLS